MFLNLKLRWYPCATYQNTILLAIPVVGAMKLGGWHMIGLLPCKLPTMNSNKINLNLNLNPNPNLNLNLISFIVYLVIDNMLRPNPTTNIYHNKENEKFSKH